MTHQAMGSGSGDPDKWDPAATRETLDHSATFQFARALVDGFWHHDRSYDRARIADPAFVDLWRRVQTAEDADWNRRFDAADPLDKHHGARAVIRLADGSVLAEELAVADAHPRGAAPWGAPDYAAKFRDLTGDFVSAPQAARFLDAALALDRLDAAALADLGLTADLTPPVAGPRGLFDL